MGGRSFTKQEQRLFYANLIIIAASLFIGCVWKRDLANISSVPTAVSAICGIGAIGMFAVLLAAQFSQCWTMIYLILQILLIMNIAVLAITLGVFCIFLPKFAEDPFGSVDPETMVAMKNGTQQIYEFFQRNSDFGNWWRQGEIALRYCGFFSLDDALGKNSTFSDPEVCETTKISFIHYIIILFVDMLKSYTVWTCIVLVVTIVILFFIFPALKKPVEDTSLPSIPLVPNKQVSPIPIPPSKPSIQGDMYAQPAPAYQPPMMPSSQTTGYANPNPGVFQAIPVGNRVN